MNQEEGSISDLSLDLNMSDDESCLDNIFEYDDGICLNSFGTTNDDPDHLFHDEVNFDNFNTTNYVLDHPFLV